MSARRLLIFISIFVFLVGLFLFMTKTNTSVIDVIPRLGNSDFAAKILNPDIEPQDPLPNPPGTIKAIYATSWSVSSEKKLNYLIKLIRDTELNAIVVDVKDFSGYVAYNTELDLPKKYDAVDPRIPKLNVLVKRLHDNGIYVIGRMAVFQDQRLPLARPDLALMSSSTGAIWQDYKKLMWLDTSSKEVWDYNIAIAKEILDRGFDEVNFDYIRFASDGNLKDIKHPFWDEKTLKTHIVRNFFKYLREQLWEYTISADLFGLVTIETNGMGIGQHLEYALPYFDAIAPMVYPSHYYKGFIGYEKPAEYPYEVIKYSMDTALARIKNYESKIMAEIGTTTPMPAIAKLRPWFQDFDLGADYDAKKVRDQIQAWYDSTADKKYNGGWMIWNPANLYTQDALNPEPIAENISQ